MPNERSSSSAAGSSRCRRPGRMRAQPAPWSRWRRSAPPQMPTHAEQDSRAVSRSEKGKRRGARTLAVPREALGEYGRPSGLDELQVGECQLLHGIWQRRVLKVLAVGLTVRDQPLEEVDHGCALVLVAVRGVEHD